MQDRRHRGGGASGAGRKEVDGQRKLYAWHAPEVDSISKGKARTPYEFGVNVGPLEVWGNATDVPANPGVMQTFPRGVTQVIKKIRNTGDQLCDEHKNCIFVCPHRYSCLWNFFW